MSYGKTLELRFLGLRGDIKIGFNLEGRRKTIYTGQNIN
jgi:hypothetical protein